MKKNIILAMILASISSAGAFGAEAIFGSEGNERCGVGTLICGKGQSISSQISEESTNISSIETFSVTTGTSGCSNSGLVENIPTNEIIYASINSEELMVEMASGRGASLVGLAQSMGCDEAEIPLFMQVGKDNYSEIYGTSGKDEPVKMLKKFRTHLKTVPQLSQRCSALQS